MRWRDKGIVIASSKYGDKHLILSLLTREHGKHKGLVRLTGNNSKFQISNTLDVEWSAKLPENLGFFKCELIDFSLNYFFYDRLKNIATISFASTIEKVLPESEPYTTLYDHFQEFIKCDNESWYGNYLTLELMLLTQLGFRLDLSRCAVTGVTENLRFVSPKTGRAISEKAGHDHSNRLLPFSQMLYDVYNNKLKHHYSIEEFQLGLKIIDYFLNKNVFLQLNIRIPGYRTMMLSQ